MKKELVTNDGKYEICAVDEGIFRIRHTKGLEYSESMLMRYDIIKEPNAEFGAELEECDSDIKIKTPKENEIIIDKKSGLIHVCGIFCEKNILAKANSITDGFKIEINLSDTEKLFGLGSAAGKKLNRRGTSVEARIINYTGYFPIPFLMSDEGWAILINSTYTHTYDIGLTDSDKLIISAKNGQCDFYIFTACDMPGLIERYTSISGRPILLPKFGYGFTVINNEKFDAKDLLEACVKFRDMDIPCDTMSLEPYWMEKYYDYSTNKKWSEERFLFPSWQPENYTGKQCFLFNLRKMGYKLSLWLCCDYDLLWEEERDTLKKNTYDYDDAEINDVNFSSNVIMDKITKQGEPWFEHLKKFVDQGIVSFKLDGALQIIEHPDRLWAGKYLDKEVHNIYPVIYAKQMQQGFSNYTGRRAFIHTPGGYSGIQQYAAAWAGDTGGEARTIPGILNLSMCGVSNTTCDMDMTTPEGIHYGFLLPWSETMLYQFWWYPWFLDKDLQESIRFYAKLRSSLFPYIYSFAHEATRTGMPIARALCLLYSKDELCEQYEHEYLFGDSLLVTVFNQDIYFPEGRWIDYFDGTVYEGGQEIKYIPQKPRGGGLFVKEGSVIVTKDDTPYLDMPIDKMYIDVYPGKDTEFLLVEDDGISYEYLDGKVAETKISVINSQPDSFELVINKRTPDFEDKIAEEPYDIREMGENHPSNIRNIPPVCDFTVRIHSVSMPKKITLDGENICFSCGTNNIAEFDVSKELHETKDLKYKINII